MSQMEMEAIIQALMALWLIPIGIAWMVRGPQGAAAVTRWALRLIVRTVRGTVGGTLVALGQFVRGKPAKRRRERGSS